MSFDSSRHNANDNENLDVRVALSGTVLHGDLFSAIDITFVVNIVFRIYFILHDYEDFSSVSDFGFFPELSSEASKAFFKCFTL
mmetsp:Transcript_16740/g.23421  ORF Transcript_16740/g.23421 Transcript_16740/m.23421 type:complete len:84 (-) Transcript_16740:319-570(-)